MKKIFALMIAVALVAGLSSCKKDEEATKTALLTYEYGWVLKSATSSPAYALENGTFATDLINDGYLFECELDDIILFKENGGMVVMPKVACEDETEYAATWKFDENEENITMQIPFFYDEEAEKCQLMSLTEDEMKIKFTFNDNETPTKGVYSFILTYRHATKSEYNK
ncbi:MAG: hypothetical protein MJZ76_07410 [Bacteroidales bacterium]|nr:hypothetical protein [Bacteroidales bacterium]